jgi:hypothetical protein
MSIERRDLIIMESLHGLKGRTNILLLEIGREGGHFECNSPRLGEQLDRISAIDALKNRIRQGKPVNLPSALARRV